MDKDLPSSPDLKAITARLDALAFLVRGEDEIKFGAVVVPSRDEHLELDALIGADVPDLLDEITRLRARVDVLTDQVAGRDEQIEQFKRGGQELGKILTVLNELIKDAYRQGATDPIGALHMLGNYLAEMLPDEGGLSLDEFNRTYHALEERRRERDGDPADDGTDEITAQARKRRQEFDAELARDCAEIRRQAGLDDGSQTDG